MGSDSWENLVMFHFLHGDSDKGADLDSSGNWLKKSKLYTNMVNVGDGQNSTLMETFYGQGSTEEGRIAALEKSRKFERVPLLEGMTCGVVSYPADKLSSDTILGVPLVGGGYSSA